MRTEQRWLRLGKIKTDYELDEFEPDIFQLTYHKNSHKTKKTAVIDRDDILISS